MTDIKKYSILTINFGSTSTKIALFENDACLVRDSITHPVEAIKAAPTYFDQYDFRMESILEWLKMNNVSLNDLDAICARGGHTEPTPGGTWLVNDAMVKENKLGHWGHHPCNLGPLCALELCKQTDHAIPLTVDTPTTDEMDPIARYSGVPGMDRRPNVQVLNIKAMSKYYAEQQGRPFEEMRLVTVMLGGGVGVVAIRDGRMVDGPDSIEGEGPFCNMRSGYVDAGQIIKKCFSGERDLDGMIHLINGESGLIGYLGTTDIRQIMADIEAGDQKSREVIEAMCYQTAKEIGGLAAAVFEGRVDAILLIGGMANAKFIVDEITRRVESIAPVVIMPGEREMEALAQGAYEGLAGISPIQEFIPTELAQYE